VILSWKGKQAREVFEGNCPKGFPADLFKRVRRSLFQLDAATRLDDLKHPACTACTRTGRGSGRSV